MTRTPTRRDTATTTPGATSGATLDRRRWLALAASSICAHGVPTAAAAPAAATGAATATGTATAATAAATATAGAGLRPRVRPGDAGWPADTDWAQLRDAVGGRLSPVVSPLDACRADATGCDALFASLTNPFVLREHAALTQTLGWVDAWTTRPSAQAIEPESADEVAAAVRFAREHRLRLVVRGGGHSYQGTSNAPDSLLIWTRRMNAIAFDDAFVPAGCPDAPRPAVTVGAGAIWGPVYDAVVTRRGRYVQGGGCLTVGVAGLVQSGGFGSFSKRYGTAAGSLLEAEVVTADGRVRRVNACNHPELYWALKGGGGGNFGVVTRLTLALHDLPDRLGSVSMRISARSDEAWRRLVARVVDLCRDRLVDAHWGEQIGFRRNRVLVVAMLYQGLARGEAEAVWQPFIDAVAAAPGDYRFDAPPFIIGLSARHFWDPRLMTLLPGAMRRDPRADAPRGNVYWSGDAGQAGDVLHGYGSAWLPAALLGDDRRARLVDALVAASRHARFDLHFNKGLAGAPPEAIAAARDTAMNPAVLDAFALLISATGEAPAYPGIPGHEPDRDAARRDRAAIGRVFDEIARIVPAPGAYVSESDYFQADWRQAFWGPHHARLAEVKRRWDPEGLFFVHHGVGSERWSPDGFVPVDPPTNETPPRSG